MSHYYSNGKLLLTGEYLVLDRATALAVPTKFGQGLWVEKIQDPQLVWESYAHDGECWFKAVFELPTFRLVKATFNSSTQGNSEVIAETLQHILQEAKKLNVHFLKSKTGYKVKTTLTFPRNWGLGTSSTLVNNIAQWAAIDAYKLLWNSFSGSGYDIANAQNNSSILYQLKDSEPIVTPINFSPKFSDQLFFVYLNKKQNSREGIAKYRENTKNLQKEIYRISEISLEMISVTSLTEFEKLLEEHEQIISSIIKLKPVKEALFPTYNGAIKSLGAWGGDFILVTGNQDSIGYFKEKGYATVLSYSDMVL